MEILAYHRTHTDDTVISIAYRGFVAKNGSTFGKGFYMSRDFTYHADKTDSYGYFIVESRVDLQKVIILDKALCIQVHGKPLSLTQQMAKLNVYMSTLHRRQIQEQDRRLRQVWNRGGESNTEVASDISRLLENKVNGLAYNGRTDGPCLVMYNFNSVVPTRWARTDKTTKEIIDCQWKNLNTKEVERILKGESPFTLRLLVKWDNLSVEACVDKCISFSRHAPSVQFMFMLRDLAQRADQLIDMKYSYVQHRIQEALPDSVLTKQFSGVINELLSNGLKNRDDGTLWPRLKAINLSDDDDEDDSDDDTPKKPSVWTMLNDKALCNNYKLLRRRIFSIVLALIKQDFDDKVAIMLTAWRAIPPEAADTAQNFLHITLQSWPTLIQTIKYISGISLMDTTARLAKKRKYDDDDDDNTSNMSDEIFVAQFIEIMFEPLRDWLVSLREHPIVQQNPKLRLHIYQALGQGFLPLNKLEVKLPKLAIKVDPDSVTEIKFDMDDIVKKAKRVAVRRISPAIKTVPDHLIVGNAGIDADNDDDDDKIDSASDSLAKTANRLLTSDVSD